MRYKIVFLGTGNFACPSIELLSIHHNLLAVVSSPNPSFAKRIADELGIKVYEPDNPNTAEFILELKKLSPDIIALADYGYILKSELLAIPKLASINLHPSLLPAYRGAAPIRWAIINGEQWTGVTTFIMDPEIDHGDILLQERVEILDSDTYGGLELRLANIGAELLLDTINRFKELTPSSQPVSLIHASYAPKISRKLREIDWWKPANEIVSLIRALSPEPSAFTIFRGKQLEVLMAVKSDQKGEPGVIVEVKGKLLVGAGGRCVELLTVKPEAKREQTALNFINGYRPRVGEIMG